MQNPQNQNQNNRDNTSKKICIISIISIISIFLIIIIYKMNRSVSLIKNEYKNKDIIVFKKNYLYKGFFDIYKDLFFMVLCLDIIFLTITSYDNNYLIQLFLDNFFMTFCYFNYLFFGPFQFGVVILCMKYGNEITFFYDEKTKRNISLDFRNIFFVFIYIFISFTLTIMIPIIYSYNYFINSIKFKRYGNYLVGKLFWYFALKYSDDISIRINRQNNENQNEREIQNFILPFDNEDALLLG